MKVERDSPANRAISSAEMGAGDSKYTRSNAEVRTSICLSVSPVIKLSTGTSISSVNDGRPTWCIDSTLTVPPLSLIRLTSLRMLDLSQENTR